jgi:hypothetical protein
MVIPTAQIELEIVRSVMITTRMADWNDQI